MSEPRWDDLRAYARQLADLLHLKDWTILFDQSPPENDDAIASIDPCEGRKVATVHICSDFWEREADEQRQTITHELIHCHHDSASEIVRVDLVKHLSQQAYDILWGGYKRQMEYCVDGLADAIAPFLPLPPWAAVTAEPNQDEQQPRP